MALNDENACAIVKKTGIKPSDAIRLIQTPIGGRISLAAQTWNLLKPSPFVKRVVNEGYKIDFIQQPELPIKMSNPKTDPEGQKILDEEVRTMLEKQVIRKVNSDQEGAISPFFARPKSTKGKWRPILSLKKVNEYVRYKKFKMTTATKIKGWIKKGAFMTSLDLSDAYFSVPLHCSAYKFVRFCWQGLTYEYLTNMFGLGPSARLFTKTLAPVIRFLKKAIDLAVVGYVDDFLMQDEDYEACALKTKAAIIIFFCLGFRVNHEKSVIEPTREVEHLGLRWNTKKMTVSLTEKRMTNIEEKAENIKRRGGCTLKELQSFLGKLEASRAAIIIARLHFRFMQALLRGKEDDKEFIKFNEKAKIDLQWWIDFARKHSTSPLQAPRLAKLNIKTDASGDAGWGGHSRRGWTQARWERKERHKHINWKEMEAAKKCIAEQMKSREHVQIEMDSLTSTCIINSMARSTSATLRQKALEIWEVVLKNQGWLTAKWIPREKNQVADFLSKHRIQVWNFGLKEDQVSRIFRRWGRPSVDLFASEDFHVCEKFYGMKAGGRWKDAFSLARWPDKSFAFPPVPLLQLALNRIKEEKIKAIVVAPESTATWWYNLKDLSIDSITLGKARKVCNRGKQKLPYIGRLEAHLIDQRDR